MKALQNVNGEHVKIFFMEYPVFLYLPDNGDVVLPSLSHLHSTHLVGEMKSRKLFNINNKYDAIYAVFDYLIDENPALKAMYFMNIELDFNSECIVRYHST